MEPDNNNPVLHILRVFEQFVPRENIPEFLLALSRVEGNANFVRTIDRILANMKRKD